MFDKADAQDQDFAITRTRVHRPFMLVPETQWSFLDEYRKKRYGFGVNL